MNLLKAVILTCLTVLFSVGCNSPFFSAPASPSPASDLGLIAVDTSEGQIQWSPYVVVHADGGATAGYQKALTALLSKGNIRGVRIGLSPYRDPIVQMISSLGIEKTGVVPNESLFDSNPEAMIDRYISIYPDIKVFQIGNEVTTINQSGGLPSMSIEQYMDIFKRIYNHILQSSNSSVVLMTQSTFGSGDIGSNELKRMVELGLKPNILSPQRVIVGINVYSSNALNEYISTRNQYLYDPKYGGYRVWVMETGNSDPSQQISHVRSSYPTMASALGAERMYWYALWAGDTGSDAGFGLIQNPYNPNQMTYSPLFKALAGVQ